MEVVIQYVEGCPHFEQTYQMVSSILETNQLQGVLRTTLVSSVAQADELGFVGSPTVLIDGADPFSVASARIGLACHLYGSGADRSGVPPVDQLEAALRGDG